MGLLTKWRMVLAIWLAAGAAPGAADPAAYWDWVREVERDRADLRQELQPKLKAARRDPEAISSQERYLLAVAQYFDGEYEAALKLSDGLWRAGAYPRRGRYLSALCVYQLHQGIYWTLEPLERLRNALNQNHSDPRLWMAIPAFIRSSPLPSSNPDVQSWCRLMIYKTDDKHFGGDLIKGTLLQLNWKYTEAEQEFLKAYEKAPQNPATLSALLLFYRVYGKLKPSVLCLRELDKLDWDPRYGAELKKDEAALARLESFNAAAVKPLLEEDGAPLYRLPYRVGEAYYLASPGRDEVQPLSQLHSGRGQHALDFLMPVRTFIHAARGGVLTEKHQTGEIKAGARELVNYIVIAHGDGTYARYFNFRNNSVRLKKGERVERGQLLGQSERTRQSLSAHLHFDVVRRAWWKPGAAPAYRLWKTVPVEFEEWQGLEPDERENAWHVSRNVLRKDFSW